MFIKNEKNREPKKIFSGFIVSLIIFVAIFNFAPRPAHAQMVVADPVLLAKQIASEVKADAKALVAKFKELSKEAWLKVGKNAVYSALDFTVNKLAYDSATWLASAANGQKPQWETSDPATYMKNIAGNAAGTAIDSFARDTGFNLCAPSSPLAKIQIGLGLVDAEAPKAPDCTWTKLAGNWQDYAKSVDQGKFLSAFSVSLDPASNDVGIALSAFGKVAESKASVTQTTLLPTDWMWKDNRDAAGGLKGQPGLAQTTANVTVQTQTTKTTSPTLDWGEPFIAAQKVFINRLAFQSFTLMLQNLSKNKGGTTANPLPDFTNPNASLATPGISGTKENLRQIIQPNFSVDANYDVLGKLTVCNRGSYNINTKPGATDCVIDDNFRQAIENKNTLRQAVDDGYIKGGKPFAFSSANKKVEYPDDGIPYRSLAILRKYRIVPVGWELAAQYLENNPDKVSETNTLQQLMDCFDNDNLPDWCRGLVDPNWVLKAPQGYCAKESYGGGILSKSTEGSTDLSASSTPSKLLVLRADDYCADEKSCISENEDGSCNWYGYCQEEKRQWKFDATSCDPIYNTCQTYFDTKGASVSYLKNTLNFCDATNAGCEKYAKASADGYASSSDSMDWNKSSELPVFLNSSAVPCDKSNEGCSGIIRTKSGLGTNLIIKDTGFEKDSVGDTINGGNPTAVLNEFWPVMATSTIVTDPAGNGHGNVLHVTDSNGTGLHAYDSSRPSYPSVFPKAFVFEPETSYTLSADIYIVSGKVSLDIGRYTDNVGMQGVSKEVNGSGYWQSASVTLLNNQDILANEFRIFGYATSTDPADFYVDNVKLEINNQPTNYSEYGNNNLVFEKILPGYLEDSCYKDAGAGDYTLKVGAPAKCSLFARKCSRDEANCEMYTDSSDNTNIPATVTDSDYCLKECSGFDTYVQAENNFYPLSVNYFIPSTATACSSASVGCSEFTNLDNVAQGGEQKEYYSYLRQCVKPGTPEASCADFYSWEGTAASGKQLIKYTLQASSTTKDVATTSAELMSDGSPACDEGVFNLQPTDPHYNPDCRQFYNQDGKITYHLYSKTISCTADCHSYRLTRAAGEACPADSKVDTAGNCLYKATSLESNACSAQENGCSEYNGNQGNNMRVIFDDIFEDGVVTDNNNNQTADGWSLTNASMSANSLSANGHSLSFEDSMSKVVGNSVSKNSSYVLSFLAKTETAGDQVNLTASLMNGTNEDHFSAQGVTAASIAVGDQWQTYKMNLPALAPDVTPMEVLRFYLSPNNLNIDIDNIKLTEITDRYYLVKDSWVTPDSCNLDQNGNSFPGFALGCSEYTDRAGNPNYLHNFNRLCQESAVGCEAVINTKNTINTANATSTDDDSLAYFVYDQNKLCSKDNKSCERLGLAQDYEGSSLFSDVYLKNDPDLASAISCTADGVGCDKFTDEKGGSTYFKNPGEAVCEWRQSSGTGQKGAFGWFKKKMNRCNNGDINSSACKSNSDCSNNDCAVETIDNPCPTDSLKTFGLGGQGNEIFQPSQEGEQYFAGLCPQDKSSCTEYIDPVSDFSGNLVYNSDFSQGSTGWNCSDNSSPCAVSSKQNVNLEGNTLYTLTVKGINTATATSSFADFYQLNTDNSLATTSVDTLSASSNKSITFFVKDSIKATLIVNKTISGQSQIILRQAITSYQLADKVNAIKGTCNQQSDVNSGCIYFNERNFLGFSGLETLDNTIDAWDKYGISGITADGVHPSFANQLLKVSPDRVCGKWLACKSYIKDSSGKDVCFSVGSCDRLNKDGSCANFLSENQTNSNPNRTYDPTDKTGLLETPDTIRDVSGYAKIGWASSTTDNLWNFSAMKQLGGVATVLNGDFELYNQTDYNKLVDGRRYSKPIGWRQLDGNAYSQSFSAWPGINVESSFSVIADPTTAASYKIDYPQNGKSLLRYSASGNYPFSDKIAVEANKTYYLSYSINTSQLVNANAVVYILDNVMCSSLLSGGVWVRPGTSSCNPPDRIVNSIQNPGIGWQTKVVSFTAPSSGFINLELAVPFPATNPSGNIFIDNIQITPALEARDTFTDGGKTIDPLFLNQTCRLYPKEDSLSCDYIDDSGVEQKGEKGYCLEYDTPPGDTNTCLMWLPVDKVTGAGATSQSDFSAGYSGQYPLYYCIGVPNTNTPPQLKNISMYSFSTTPVVDVNTYKEILLLPSNKISTGQAALRYGNNNITITYDDSHDDDWFDLQADIFNGLSSQHIDIGNLLERKYVNNEKIDITISSKDGTLCSFGDPGSGDINWASCATSNNSNLQTSTLFSKYIVSCGQNAFKCGNTNIVISYNFYIPYPCTKIVNVVGVDGQNKAWVDRLKDATIFLLCNKGINNAFPTTLNLPANYVPSPDNTKCTYASFASPFGALVPPIGDGSLSFKGDPTQWSGYTNNLPLAYGSSTDNGVMGQLNSADSPSSNYTLQSIFSASNNVWNWDGTKNSYVLSPSENWSSNLGWCGHSLRTSTDTNCAIAPSVTNIKFDGRNNGENLYGRGFVNLTFNSQVDSNQKPLVEYDIDWGDGETLTVSGVEMPAQSDPLKPHSAFHAYDYYDLKNKFTIDLAHSTHPTLSCVEQGDTINGKVVQTSYCEITPRIKLRDNWGWCTEGNSTTPCPGIDPDSGGVCVNSSRVASAGNTCWSNNNLSDGSTFGTSCPSAFSTCSDGFVESTDNGIDSNKITVYKE